MNAAELNAITDWLIDGARSAPMPSQLVSQCCERMVAVGLPLWRVGVFIRTLHPEILTPALSACACGFKPLKAGNSEG